MCHMVSTKERSFHRILTISLSGQEFHHLRAIHWGAHKLSAKVQKHLLQTCEPHGLSCSCLLSHSVISSSLPPHGLSMEFSKQKAWNGLPFPSPGNLPDPRIKARSPALQEDSLPSEAPGKPLASVTTTQSCHCSEGSQRQEINKRHLPNFIYKTPLT